MHAFTPAHKGTKRARQKGRCFIYVFYSHGRARYWISNKPSLSRVKGGRHFSHERGVTLLYPLLSGVLIRSVCWARAFDWWACMRCSSSASKPVYLRALHSHRCFLRILPTSFLFEVEMHLIFISMCVVFVCIYVWGAAARQANQCICAHSTHTDTFCAYCLHHSCSR